MSIAVHYPEIHFSKEGFFITKNGLPDNMKTGVVQDTLVGTQ